MKLNDPLSKYAPPGARVPTYNGTPITLVNLATHTSALPRGTAAVKNMIGITIDNIRGELRFSDRLRRMDGGQ